MDTKEKEADSPAGKKERFYRRMCVCLLAFFLLAAGCLGGLFLFYEEGRQREIEELQLSLKETQQREQELLLQKEEWERETEMVPVFAGDEGLEEQERIPFSVNLEDWKYVLVNETHPLSADFEPLLAKTKNGQQVDRRIKSSLEEMIAAAAKEGHKLMICSSYRDYERQDELMDASIAKYIRRGMDYTAAFFETKKQIALTGASEHHTGLAVDIVGVRHQSLDAAQAKTKEAAWLKEHGPEYGFILRFPEDKEDITGIAFESWHFRYVGKEAARYMQEHNLCLEEFVELAQRQQEMDRAAGAAAARAGS